MVLECVRARSVRERCGRVRGVLARASIIGRARGGGGPAAYGAHPLRIPRTFASGSAALALLLALAVKFDKKLTRKVWDSQVCWSDARPLSAAAQFENRNPGIGTK